jgi:hypothetical protein
MFCRLTVSGTTGSQSINGIRIILITQQQELQFQAKPILLILLPQQR